MASMSWGGNEPVPPALATCASASRTDEASVLLAPAVTGVRPSRVITFLAPAAGGSFGTVSLKSTSPGVQSFAPPGDGMNSTRHSRCSGFHGWMGGLTATGDGRTPP